MKFRRIKPGVAFVVGVSHGVEMEMAHALLREGWSVGGLSRTQPHIDGLWHQKADLTQPNVVEGALRAFLVGRADALDLLVYAPGTIAAGAHEIIPQKEVENIRRVHLDGLSEAVRYVLPGMRAQGRGEIVFLGSVVSALPVAFFAIYTAMKAAQSAFAESLRAELAGSGVRIREIVMGRIETKGLRETIVYDKTGYPSAMLYDESYWLSKFLMGRSISPKTAAKRILSSLGRSSGVTYLPKRLRFVLLANQFGLPISRYFRTRMAKYYARTYDLIR